MGTTDGSMMAYSSGIQGVTGLAGAYAESESMRAQGSYEKTMAEINARNLELEAEDAVRRGDDASNDARRKAKQLQGSQRAALAASGIAVDSGSAADIQAETAYLSKLDADQIKNNAWREAFGIKSKASEVRRQGRMANDTAKYRASSTLLTGGMRALSHGLEAGYYAGRTKGDRGRMGAGRRIEGGSKYNRYITNED